MRFKQQQKGFSLVTAIFILVVLAVLGSYMALMGVSQNQTTAWSVQGVRAWYAALAGYEWVVERIESTGNCPALPVTMNIEGFTVSIPNPGGCVSETVIEGGEIPPNYQMFEISVTAERGTFGNVDYVSRKLTATYGGR